MGEGHRQEHKRLSLAGDVLALAAHNLVPERAMEGPADVTVAVSAAVLVNRVQEN